jgi:hypothetical protein
VREEALQLCIRDPQLFIWLLLQLDLRPARGESTGSKGGRLLGERFELGELARTRQVEGSGIELEKKARTGLRWAPRVHERANRLMRPEEQLVALGHTIAALHAGHPGMHRSHAIPRELKDRMVEGLHLVLVLDQLVLVVAVADVEGTRLADALVVLSQPLHTFGQIDVATSQQESLVVVRDRLRVQGWQ